jgi:large subunit ribosomal protein L1
MYSLKDAALIKVVASAKFDESVDIVCRKANQMVEVVTLPHGTGKDVKVLALVTLIKKRSYCSWMDYVGLDEYYKKLKMVG